jgi:hypothetical protein
MPVGGKSNRRFRDRCTNHFSGHPAIGGQPLFASLVEREKTRHFSTNGLEVWNNTESTIDHEGMPAPPNGFFDLPRDLVHSNDPKPNDSDIKRRGLSGVGHPI